MFNSIMLFLTDPVRVLCTILAFGIPFSVYKINNRLHKYGDPPWKETPEKDENQ